jgi:hypothetical protein
MSPDQGPITAPKGQASSTSDPEDGTTQGTPLQDKEASPTAPAVDGGQAKASDADKPSAPASKDDIGTFYDPKDLPEEQIPIYKSMQAAFTKGMQ